MGCLLGVVAGCSLLASVWWGGVCGGGCRSGCVNARRCATQGAEPNTRTLGGFCVPVLFFFGLSAGACRGLLGVRVWGSYLGSWWIVGTPG